MRTQAGVNVIRFETPQVWPVFGPPGIIAHQLIGRTCGKLSEEQCPHVDSGEHGNNFAFPLPLAVIHTAAKKNFSN